MKVTIELDLTKPLDVEELCGILQGAVNAKFYIVPISESKIPDHSLKDLVESWTKECLKIQRGERLLIGGLLSHPGKRAYANFCYWVKDKNREIRYTRLDFLEALQSLYWTLITENDGSTYIMDVVLTEHEANYYEMA